MRAITAYKFNRSTSTLAIMIAMILALVISAFASAAQMTGRSVALSTSVKGEQNVSYAVAFTAPTAAGAVLVEFCTNTPLIGESCTAPAGMSLASAATTDATIVGTPSANKIIMTDTIGAASNVEIELTNVTNPSAAGTIYARILTYESDADAAVYDSATPTVGDALDQGSVAIAITDAIVVSGDVLESLAFCVSGAAIADDCAAPTTPTLALGQDISGVRSLTTDVSTGQVFVQLSTNAVNGAVVSLKSNTADCGGLVRAGAATNLAGCGIAPAKLSDAFDDNAKGKALFGVRTAAATPGGDATGTLEAMNDYNDTTYLMNFTSGNATGVTSVYGDQFLNTAGAPANNQNMALTFGASISNNTPAGRYSADISLIATGTF